MIGKPIKDMKTEKIPGPSGVTTEIFVFHSYIDFYQFLRYLAVLSTAIFLFIPVSKLSKNNCIFLANIICASNIPTVMFGFGITQCTLRNYCRATSSRTSFFDFCGAHLNVSTKRFSCLLDLG